MRCETCGNETPGRCRFCPPCRRERERRAKLAWWREHRQAPRRRARAGNAAERVAAWEAEMHRLGWDRLTAEELCILLNDGAEALEEYRAKFHGGRPAADDTPVEAVRGVV